MTAGKIIILPKPDRRYKLGNIATDKRGKLRGHPDTVVPKRLDVPLHNPPLVVSHELAKYLEERLDG